MNIYIYMYIHIYIYISQIWCQYTIGGMLDCLSQTVWRLRLRVQVRDPILGVFHSGIPMFEKPFLHSHFTVEVLFFRALNPRAATFIQRSAADPTVIHGKAAGSRAPNKRILNTGYCWCWWWWWWWRRRRRWWCGGMQERIPIVPILFP